MAYLIRIFTIAVLVTIVSPLEFFAQSESVQVIARMLICGGIESHEPVNASENFPADIGTVYCFTEIRDAGDPTTITHRWYHGDSLVAEVSLNVQGDRFRTWSSKQIASQAAGEWKIEVVDASGTTLKETAFRVGSPEGTQME